MSADDIVCDDEKLRVVVVAVIAAAVVVRESVCAQETMMTRFKTFVQNSQFQKIEK